MKKIKLKTLYLIGIITIGLLGLGIGSTYAMFTTSIEIDNPITINTTLTCEEEVIDTTDIFIEANDFRVIVININNITSSGLNYSSFYITDNSDIDVGVTHKFSDGESPTGSIETNTNKKIYIQIKNNSTVKTKVTLGVLSSTGYIIKSENMTLVNDTNIDTEKPTLTITKSTSTSRTVTYTFTFSKKVSNFTSSDITVSEGTKGTFTKVSDTKYTLVVTHSSDGAKTITVAENVCNDLSGNNNTAKSLTNTIDTIKPTVTITKSTSTSRTVTYTFTFSEAVSGFTASGITVSEGTTGKVYTGRATTWTGKVALIYSSDYGYAAEISNAIGSLGLRKHCTKMTLPNYSDTYCTSNNWLYPILSSGKSNARIMGHSTKEVYFAWYVTGNGSVGTEIVSWYEYNIVPTLYLNTSVSINTTGNGSSSNPYQIVS